MTSGKQTVRDLDVAGKRVLVRCDFNVPLEGGRITDDRRIVESLTTLRYLLDRGASLVLASHLGRPKGPSPELSLRPVAERLSELLGVPVRLLPDSIGPEVEAACKALQPGQVVMLENVRFHPEEEANDPAFARALASLADVFVNDAFGTAHRAHASTEGVAHLLPAVAGLLVEKELAVLGAAMDNPGRPFMAVLGGAKVKDKIHVIENLLPKVDRLALGGGMCFTFLKALGQGIGASLLDESSLEFARRVLETDRQKLLLPTDVVVASELIAGATTRVTPASGIPDGMIGGDIGPASAQAFGDAIRSAGTVIWNGPMGVFELEPFSSGTRKIAEAMAECEGTTIVGGGDSAAAIEKFGYADDVTHVSTGGGASLELLEGKQLPGIAALMDRK